MSPPIRVLYVDDSPLDRQLVKDALEQEDGGFQLLEAGSRAGFEAALAAGGYDLVLSDFNIFGFEGLQVIDAVRALPNPVPVVIVTGTGSEEVAVEAMKRGADDYVIKTAKHIRRLAFALHAVLEKHRSGSDLLVAYEKTIEGWSRALDLRDKETEGHTRRVTELAVELARCLEVPAEQLVHLRRGALLHDIGKLGVPDQILLKPEPLTAEEWVIMRRHPDYARELLTPIAFLRPALAIPCSHHERWDGTGYPQGLRGEAIPLMARIFAVADVWDALRSDRPYRKAWSHTAALEHIKASAGTHFDPAVVAAFLDLAKTRERAANT